VIESFVRTPLQLPAVPSRVFVVVAVLLGTVSANAHTLAGTLISVAAVRAGVVTITIAAEADPLIAKLEALAGVPSSEALTTSADRRARLESLLPTLRANIDAQIAGTPLALELQDLSVDDTAQTEIHLTGRIPTEASRFTWRSTFIFGAYRLGITSGDAAEVVEWLQGPQTSTPITLEPLRGATPSSALGLIDTRIVHSLAMGALIVYFIRRVRAQRLAGG
jgi:hypothetical protein